MATTSLSPAETRAQRTFPPASRSLMTRRHGANYLMWGFCIAATLLALIPLILVISYVTVQGLKVMNLDFFTLVEKPAGEIGGGMKHAILGTLIIVGLASVVGIPFGILGGIYLSEFGDTRFGFAVRFAADVLNGIPSIIIGMFVYAIWVLPLTRATDGAQSYSAWAGGFALGIMMVPTIMRTTEEIVRLVPMSLREGALALGDTRWHTVLKVVLGAAKGGVVTGVLLAIARVSGETAPLLFTIAANTSVTLNPNDRMAALPVKIFEFAQSPDPNWNSLAWGGSFVLVMMIFILSLAARYFTRGRLGS